MTTPMDILASSRTAAPAAAVLLAFDRLLTAGALYPLGHVNFAAAVAAWREAAAPAGRSVVIEAAGGDLRILGEAVPEGRRGRERVLGLWEKLGLASVRIDTDADETALHELAVRLLNQRREADAAGHLKEADFDGLPETVTVTARTFRRRWSDGIDAALVPLLEALVEDVAGACADGETAASVRGTLERMFRAFLADGGDGEPALCTPGDRILFESSLRQDPGLMGRALRAVVEREGSLAGFDDALDDAHEALASAGAQRALHLLLEAMAGPDRARDDEPVAAETRRVDDDASFRIPLAELQATFADLEQACGEAPAAPAGDLREDAAVCLAILALGPAPAVARQALAGLHQAVGRARSLAEREHLREMAVALVDAGDPALTDQVLPRLAVPFRERGVDDVADFWFSLAAGDPERAALVWPHAVIELLGVDQETAMRGLSVLQSLATGLEPDRMQLEAGRFGSLPGFVGAAFNKALFHRPRSVMYGVYAALLETPLADTFAGWLQEGWLRLPADSAGGLAARAAGPYKAGLRALYRDVLLHGRGDPDGPPPRSLLEAARHAVEQLPLERRDEDWVPVALLVLGRWHAAPSRRLLERVVGERRRLVLRAWPAACRHAAQSALLGGETPKEQP